ncbi:hypothetical protein [Mongoliitalea daihaiensis]|uniref:hypothetical protein n=1 Tax=Mongoliitalea daihaiensis TaxID=2782006 RepID=UPI001F419731|nr:hypothetical protein [Mongoliitalea daihaiensis]UJP66858.1 hypothetical protein IPZ59_09830 [Mongoliitalea daihaiensis]
MKRLKRGVFLAIAFLFIQVSAFAQCAMCRATVENNVSNGDTTVGAGLNMGILYLLAAPYTIALIIGLLWYKNAKKRKTRYVFHGDKF